MIKITKISAKNFKSFKELNIDFSKFTVIVGANASGKSNFVRALKFIKDIMLFGVEDAISLQGGIKYLKNLQTDSDATLSLSFNIEVDEPWIRSLRFLKTNNETNPNATIKEIYYTFEIKPAKKGQGYSIISDNLKIRYNIVSIPSKEQKDDVLLDSIELHFYKEKSRYKYKCQLKDDSKYKDKTTEIAQSLGADFFCVYMHDFSKELMLNRLSMLMPPYFIEESLINIFDFDPKKLKRACSITALTHLEEDGGNLASVIQRVLRSKESRHRFSLLLKDLLPSIKNVAIKKSIDQSISYQVIENYSNNEIYSNFLSDGTVSIIAFIVALYFENQAKVLIFEEPERNIHPKLLRKLITIAKDVTETKQVIFTTHNAEILRNVDLEDVRLISRDSAGYSCISKPCENESVITFMDNEIGIEELFLNDWLG